MRVEERFIPGEYLIKAYPELRYNRSKGYVGFLTNLRLFFGDGRNLHDISLGSVEAITWGRVRRWSVWMLLIAEIVSAILMVAIIGFLLIFLVPLLWFFWREDAVSLKVGPREVIIFGEPRTLNDIAKNIRLHQAVLRSGEAGGALGQRILEAMPMEAQPPPEEGGPLAADYAREVDGSRRPSSFVDLSTSSRTDEDDPYDDGYPPPENMADDTGLGKKKRPVDDWQGREALGQLESQATDKDRSLAAKLAYLLWAGPPNPTKLMLIGGHILLFLAIMVYVIADTVAYFNEEAASPWTRFAELLVLAGLGAFLAVIIRQIDNRYRGVEPERDEIIMKLGYKDYPLRYICHRAAHFFILSGLGLTFLLQNLTPFLVGAFLGSVIMTSGRITNLLMKPQWLHQTKPWPKWRTIKLGWNGVRLIAVLIVFGMLFPFFESHDAELKERHLNSAENPGWELKEEFTISRGLGAVQGGLRLYQDPAEDEGHPALLVLITVKEPRGILWDRIKEEIFAGMAQQEDDKNVNQEERLYFDTRTTVQGYETNYFIYNGTAKASTFFTEGAEIRLIGEGWYAKREKVMVIAIGFAQISTETLSTEPVPPEQLPPELHDEWNQTVDLLPTQLKDDPRLKEIFPVPDPTNTTDTKNWEELYHLIPRVIAN